MTNVPFSYPKTILYIESYYDVEVNRYIRENYRQIVADFAEKHIGFLYLPCLFEDPAYRRMLEYNYPAFSQLDSDSIAQLYKELVREFLLTVDETNVYRYGQTAGVDYYRSFSGCAFVLFDTVSNENEFCWHIATDIPPKNLFNGFCEDYFKRYDSNFREIPTGLHFQKIPILPRRESKPPKKTFRLFKPKENEEFELEAELLEKIEQLKERGSLKLIGKIIEELQEVTRHVSPLYITNDYRIFLKDYGMREVVMAPLPKCLYLLYLRHPEGIRFKKLYKYQDELLSIYRNVTVHNDADTAAESILALIDPLNNSANEKCSRIRFAFVEIITDELAKNYYITGLRGERKRITLDRSLVEYDKGINI